MTMCKYNSVENWLIPVRLFFFKLYVHSNLLSADSSWWSRTNIIGKSKRLSRSFKWHTRTNYCLLDPINGLQPRIFYFFFSARIFFSCGGVNLAGTIRILLKSGQGFSLFFSVRIALHRMPTLNNRKASAVV